MYFKDRLEAKAHQKQYGLGTPDYHDRVVIIVVDDGIATGATTAAAIHEIRYQHPKTLILAAAVASQESAKTLSALVDELVILHTPTDFYAVGQYFVDFSQVTDAEVISILHPTQEPNNP